MFRELSRQYSYLSFNRVKQQAFLEDLSSLLEDGVPAQQALSAISQISRGIETRVAHSILHALGEGKFLADGMEHWFPQHIVALIRSGEEGGTLFLTMGAAAKSLAQRVSVASSLLSSLTYPLVVFVLACAVAIFLRRSIFVNFISIKPVEQWPDIGKTFLGLATFIEFWWWAVLIGLIAVTILIVQIFRLYIGERRRFFDEFIPFSVYRSFVAAHFMEMLGLLVSNGIAFKNALAILQRSASRYLIWHIYMMQLRLGGGKENIAEVIDTGLISKEDIIRLKIIAQGKGFEHALIRLGEQAIQKSSKHMQLIGKIFGGVFLAVDAMIAIFMILSVYSVGTFIGGAG